MNKDEQFLSCQIHKGYGDNVYGDKNIYTINNYLHAYDDIAPKNIKKIVSEILYDLRDYKVDEAKIKLITLKSLDNLDEESSAIIETLSIHSELIDEQNLENALSVINTYLSKYENPLIRDLCLSASIKLCCKKDNHQEAIERYKHETNSGNLSKKAYFDFLADSTELETTFTSHKFSLTESELEGIVYGALRHNKGQLAYGVAEFLNNTFSSYNSKLLLLYSRAVRLNPIITTVHYWLCTPEQRSELLDISNQIIQLFEESGSKDCRIFNIATPIIHYLRGDHEKLLLLCGKNIDKVEKINKFVAGCIDKNVAIKNTDISEIDFDKVFSDESYKKELLENILIKKQISPKEVFLLSRIASPQQIKNWLEDKGGFSTGDEVEVDFYNFYLKTLSVINNKDLQYIKEIRCDFNALINKYSEKINELNPEYIHEVAERLLTIDLSYEASQFLELLILSDSDFWNSPFIDTYIHCLYRGQQYLKLSQFLDKVQKETWKSNIFIIKAAITSINSDFEGAEKIINEALNVDELSLISWEYLINLNIRLKNKKIESILDDIPEELFNKPSEVGYRLLILMAKNNLFNKAEKIILSWFIKDPNQTAIYLTNFNFSLGINDIEFGTEVDSKILVSDKVINCLGGITYKSDDKVITKLIVKDPESRHPIFLDSSSPIVNLLNELSIGEKRKYSMNIIEIIERTSPYATAVKLAIKLREELNDGRDSFHSFTVPDDPDEMIQVFKEKLSFVKDSKKDEVFKNSLMPIIFKTHFMRGAQDPIKAALEQFTSDKYSKIDLIDLGDESAKDIILDIYTICYLTLTQLSKNIEHVGLNIKITNETKSCIENWIAKIESGKYLLAGVDDEGKFVRNTSEDIKRKFGDMINEMKHIIKIADIVSPELIDVPPQLLQFREFIDTVTYSAILASIGLDIPLLYIDQVFGRYLQTFGVKIYNPRNLLLKLGTSLDFKSKKLGLYLHASNCIPYVLPLSDFYLLAKSEDDFAHIWIIKMINKYPQTIDNNFEAYIKFLVEILSIFISNGYLQGKFLLGNPRRDFRVNTPFSFGVDDVFYACCNNILKYPNNSASEEKIAIFLYHLFERYKNIEQVITWLKIAANSYISGHFMSFDEINRKYHNHHKLK